jgi:inner membrane protein
VFKNPLFVKFVALGAVVVALLVGLSSIEGVVRDRQFHRSQAQRGVADSLAGPQTLLGPLIHQSCTERWESVVGSGAEQRRVEEKRGWRLVATPSRLALAADAALEPRARGLHSVNTFQLKSRLSATWDSREALVPQASTAHGRIDCGPAVLMVAVGDARGIRGARLRLGGQTLELRPGTEHPSYPRGLHAVLPEALVKAPGVLGAELELELLGTERVAVVPLGGESEVRLRSPWPHPSFGGRFLPSERTVEASGFTAHWRLSQLASSAARDVTRGARLCNGPPGEAPTDAKGCVESFWVDFIDPVNPYTLSDRATKYGVLFIVLTFVAVGLFELLGRLRVHPVQYALVGAALTLFFLLLLSLAEHLRFEQAYAAAATGCVLLLTYYASHILGSLWRGLPFGALMALLYGMLFVLLQLEQMALVVGSVALFLVLAAVMVLTRKLDWYALAKGAPASHRDRGLA